MTIKTLKELTNELGEVQIDALVTEWAMMKIAKAAKYDRMKALLDTDGVTVSQLRDLE